MPTPGKKTKVAGLPRNHSLNALRPGGQQSMSGIKQLPLSGSVDFNAISSLKKRKNSNSRIILKDESATPHGLQANLPIVQSHAYDPSPGQPHQMVNPDAVKALYDIRPPADVLVDPNQNQNPTDQVASDPLPSTKSPVPDASQAYAEHSNLIREGTPIK